QPRLTAYLGHRYPAMRPARRNVAMPNLTEFGALDLFALRPIGPLTGSLVLVIHSTGQVQRIHPPTPPIPDNRVQAEQRRGVQPSELRPPTLAVRVPRTEDQRVRLPVVQRPDIVYRRRPQRTADLTGVETLAANLAVAQIRVGIAVREIQRCEAHHAELSRRSQLEHGKRDPTTSPRLAQRLLHPVRLRRDLVEHDRPQPLPVNPPLLEQVLRERRRHHLATRPAHRLVRPSDDNARLTAVLRHR